MSNSENVDVLIYISNMKSLIKEKPNVKQMMIGQGSEEYFYELLKIIATKNFNKTGSPNLTKEQVDLISSVRKYGIVFKYGNIFLMDIILN